MSIKIYPEEPCLIPVEYESNPLAVYDKDYADIEEVVMCFKKSPKDSEDLYLVKYLNDGIGGNTPSGDVLIDQANNRFTLVKGEDDVVPVYAKGYGIYIGVKVVGLAKYLWLRVVSSGKVVVETDGISI